MPGLIRGVARTAVVAGTATAVSNNVSRRQSNRWAQQQQPQPGYMAPVGGAPQQQMAAAPMGAEDPVVMIRQLYAMGILTDEEFQMIKARV